MFKLSRFCQERFIQELCCDLFAMAIASQPYSCLRTSSHALVWDPGDPGSAVQRSRRPHAARVVSLGRINCTCVCCCTWSYSIKWFLCPYGPIFGTKPALWSTTEELEFKVFVPKCIYCLLWCRLPTTHPFICLLCMAVDATPSLQHWHCPLPASYPHTCTLQDPYNTELEM